MFLIAPWIVATANRWVWHRGDNVVLNAADVSDWPDIWGSTRTLIQGTAALQALWESAGILGRPCLRFDGVANNYYQYAATWAGEAAMEVMVVGLNDVDPSANAALSGYWDFGSTGAASLIPFQDGNIYDGFGRISRPSSGNPAASMASPYVYNVITTAAEWTNYLQGVQQSSVANTVGWEAAGGVLGSGDGLANWLDGRIAEFIAWNRKLTTAERTLMYHYFNARYSGLGTAIP